MATAHREDTDHGEDNFILEIHRIKERIEITFAELRDCLSVRENTLIEELENILARYRTYKREVDKMTEKKKDIENIRNANTGMVINSTVKTLHDNFLKELNREFEFLEIPVKPKMVNLLIDNNNLLDEVNKLGKLLEKAGVIDYTNTKQPLVSVCESGNRNEQLYWPRGVTADKKTGNIYIADAGNHCVKVFDSTAKYIFKFGDSKGESEMNYPKGLTICGNRILISQYSNCIMNYQLDGKFISKVGKDGKGNLEFNNPWGITINKLNGDVYICDVSNNRIQILSENLHFKSQFGRAILTYPRDIKINRDNIFILDESNPCLHIFNKDLVLQKNIISIGKGKQVISPLFFFLDNSDNILISDYGSNSIRIFNSKYECIHTISIPEPSGITVDDKDRIIVVSYANKNCLQIF
ncbi:PEP-CTERM domain protein [Oopsacas minuta]|uniref:PEP-CTERM domain protein n=1 Tax=Oopsacas minuta TaxID=111878 RepID=A0AAV7K713_9METZ|nr:PEP-CTERM domain protein [Oopsacas minuta]